MPELDELDELLTATLRRGDLALAHERLDEDGVALLRGRIAARRGRRRVLQGVAAAPLVVGLAAGGWALGGVLAEGRVAPASPAPASSAAPAPSPSPSPGDDDPASSGGVGLPATVPLRAGVLEHASAGWVLGLYESATADGVPQPSSTVPPVRQTVVLAAPDGTVSHVVDLDPTAGLPEGAAYRRVRLLDWRPGATTALVQAWSMPIDPSAAVGASFYAPLYDLDLRTGALTRSPDDLGLPEGSSGGTAPRVVAVAAGHPVWVVPAGAGARLQYRGNAMDLPPGDGHHTVSPDGSRLLTGGVVVDLATMTEVGALPAQGPAGQCLPVSWWSADEVLARCTDGDPDAAGARGEVRWVSFRIGALDGAGTVVRRASDDPRPAPEAVLLADHDVAFSGDVVRADGSDVARGVWRLADGALRVVVPPGEAGSWSLGRGVHGWSGGGDPDRVLVASTPEGSTVARLVAIDPAGSVTTVLDAPRGTAPGGSPWSQGLSSWVIAR